MIDSLFHEERLPRAIIPSEMDGSCVAIDEVCECGELGILAMDGLQ